MAAADREEYDPDPDLDDSFYDEPSWLSRMAWRLVWVLSAILLLAVVTMASVAMLAPDAFTGPCVRTALVRPEPCAPRLGNLRD